MTAREMWVSEIEGSDEMKAPAFTVRLADEGVGAIARRTTTAIRAERRCSANAS